MRLRPDTVWIDGETPVDSVNAQDYATIQLAVDAVTTSGGVVYIPAGDYNYSGTGDYEATKFTVGLVVPDNVKLKGAGRGVTILHANENYDEEDDIILLQGDNCGIEDLTIQGPCHLASLALDNTGRGVVVGSPDTDDQYGNYLRRVVILDTAGYGLYIEGSENSKGVAFLGNYEDVRVWNQSEQASLYLGAGTTTNTFRKCVFRTISENNTEDCDATSNVLIQGAEGTVFDQCHFEGYANAAADEIPFVIIGKDTGTAAVALEFRSCWFELDATDQTTGLVDYYVKTAATGLVVNVKFEGCHIVRVGGSTPTDHKGGKFFYNGSTTVAHRNITFDSCNVWLAGDPTDSPADALLEVCCATEATSANFIMRQCSAHKYNDTTKHRAWRFYGAGYVPTAKAETMGCMNMPLVDAEIFNTTYYGGVINGRLIYYAGDTGPMVNGAGQDGIFFYGLGNTSAAGWQKVALIQVATAFDGTPVEGSLWYDLTTHKLKVRHNSDWDDCSAGP